MGLHGPSLWPLGDRRDPPAPRDHEAAGPRGSTPERVIPVRRHGLQVRRDRRPGAILAGPPQPPRPADRPGRWPARPPLPRDPWGGPMRPRILVCLSLLLG